MLKDITSKYRTFGDATINKIVYTLLNTDTQKYCKELVVVLTCLNWQTDKWDKVQLIFSDVTMFRYTESKQVQSSAVFEALLIKEHDHIVVDFFPIQIDGLGRLEEDPNSSFSVHCKRLRYEVVT